MLSLDRQNQLRDRYQAETPGWRPATEVYADRVRDAVQTDSRILDLGCGRGGLIEQLGHPLHRIVGIDPDLPSLFEHRLPKTPRLGGFSDALPFKERSFDLVFCSWLLEHLENPAQDLAEIGRVLRPGGRFIFLTPNRQHPITWLTRILGRVKGLQGRLVKAIYDRDEDDTFPTRYRANGVDQINGLLAPTQLIFEDWVAIPDPTYLGFSPLLYQGMRWVDSRLSAERGLHLVGTLIKQ